MATLTMLCGVPGSGKSTYAQKYLSDSVYLSSDAIRAELYGDASIQGDPAQVFALMQKRALAAIKDGNNVVYDATNINRKSRRGIIQALPHNTQIHCIVIWAPIEVCIQRDAARDRTVGKEVIMKMLRRFQIPMHDEGFDFVDIFYTYHHDINQYVHDLTEAMKIPHDNPHHQLSIYEHAKATERNCKLYSRVGFWHDCGKPYVKEFKDGIAHYHDHQNVGAWIALGLGFSFYETWLINNHMEPFFNSKYYRSLNPLEKQDIDHLHKADLLAH